MNYLSKLIIILLFAVSSTTVAVPQQIDKITAIVNDSVVLQSDVDNMLKLVRINAKDFVQLIPNNNALQHQVLERLVIDEIILQRADKIQIPEKDIDATFVKIAEQHKFTVNQLHQRLLTNDIKLQDYRNDIRREMMIAAIRNNEVSRRIIILPQEVDILTSQLTASDSLNAHVHLSHILISLPENATNQQNQSARNTVNKILAILKKGANFSKLAIMFSVNPDILKGGIIGWSKVKDLPTIFAKRVQYAKKGDIIGPIRSRVGLHIIKINEMQSGNAPLSITEVKAFHIFIKLSPIMNNKQAYTKIQEIAKKIKIGKITFSEAVKKYSQDPRSASRGGELDWHMLNNYDIEFRDGLMSLNKGEISKPIRSSFGWHLIQLEDASKVNKTDMAKKEYAYHVLFNHKFNEEAQIWMQELRASAYVKIINDNNVQ